MINRAATTRQDKQPRWLRGPRARIARRGGVTMVLIAVILIGLGCLALAYDVACLTNARQQMRAACESSSLAGTSQLMDRSPLYPRSVFRSSGSDVAKRNLQTQRFFAAESAALEFARRNTLNGQPLQLAPGADADGHRQLVFGFVEDSTQPDSEFQTDGAKAKVNSLQVQVTRTSDHVPPLVSRMFGSRYRIVCVSRATVDQQVYGFRPTRSVAAPVAPLLIEFDDPTEELDLQLGGSEYRGCDDRYRVDERTGRVVRGGDGVPEYVFWLGAAKPPHVKTTGTLHRLKLGGASPSNFRRLATDGLGSSVLAELGGEIALDPKGRLRASVVSTRAHGALASALLAIRGEKRVFFWGSAADSGNRRREAEARGFLAGRVVNVDSKSQACVVTVQPCLMQTCTALIRSGQPRNAWIGKLVLNR